MKHLYCVLAIFALGALLVPASGIAARPAKGAVYVIKVAGKPEGRFATNKTGTKIGNFMGAGKSCNPVPLKKPVSMKIKRSGAYSFSGTRTDVIGQTFTIKITGKFKTSKKASGTMRYTRPGCDSGTLKYTAKFLAKGSL